jgi:small conductance mechanosensitive channel
MSQALGELAHLDMILGHFVIPFALKVIGAFVLWFTAGFLIRVSRKIIIRALEKRKVDPTLIVYAEHTLGLGLKALALILILGIFGIETTSFSAILAAAGVAIGVAWSGLLSNFAAGIFLIIFRPFKLGDSISAGGVTGVVREIGLFATSIDNGENLRYFVGNNKLFSDNILTYSSNPYRLLQFKVQLAHSVDPEAAIPKFLAPLARIPGVREQPGVTGEISEFTLTGPVILLKVACHQHQFSSVQAEGNRSISAVLKAEAFPVPEIRSVLIQSPGRSET